MFALGGFTGNEPALLAGGNFISYIFSLALAIWLSDRLGRRTCMLLGCTLMGVVLTIGGVLAHEVYAHESNKAKARQFGSGVTAVLYIYTFIYGSTWLTTWYVHHSPSFQISVLSPPGQNSGIGSVVDVVSLLRINTPLRLQPTKV